MEHSCASNSGLQNKTERRKITWINRLEIVPTQFRLSEGSVRFLASQGPSLMGKTSGHGEKIIKRTAWSAEDAEFEALS